MGYRPEGYQEILARTMGAIAPIDARLVEAGADAMLEGLKKTTYSEYNGEILLPVAYFEKKGQLVFIPEKKADE